MYYKTYCFAFQKRRFYPEKGGFLALKTGHFRNVKAQLLLFNGIIFTYLNKRVLIVLLKRGLLKEPTRQPTQPVFLYRININ